jgi:hypothetical protein
MIKAFLLAIQLLLLGSVQAAMTINQLPGLSITESPKSFLAVEITNTGSEPIEALNLEWRFTWNSVRGSDKEIHTHHHWDGGILLKPGQKYVASPRVGVHDLRVGFPVAFVLDGVLYASGRVAGPNAFGLPCSPSSSVYSLVIDGSDGTVTHEASANIEVQQ